MCVGRERGRKVISKGGRGGNEEVREGITN